MSPFWRTVATLAFALSAFANQKPRPSISLEATEGDSHGGAPHTSPETTPCPVLWSLSTEIAPSMSFVRLSTLNDALGGDGPYAFEGSFAGIGIRQSFHYAQTLRFSLSGAYSRTLSGAGDGLYSRPSARGQTFDATGEIALSLAADDARRVCFEPFAGYALLDMYLNMQLGLGPERTEWDHLRYYGPMAGLGLSLLPVETLRMGVRLGFVRSHLWDKQLGLNVYQGKNRLYTVVSALRFDYSATQNITTHASIDYQGWSAGERYEEASVVPYLRRVVVGFGLKVAY